MDTKKNPLALNRVFLSLISLYLLQSCSGKNATDQLVVADKVTIRSKILNEDRTIWIHLPQGYESGKAAYPVLYVLDADWEAHFANAVATSGYLHGYGRIPELIVVGILNTRRDRDMIPVTLEGRPFSGGAANFLSFITDELMPHINAGYRTKPFSILFGGSNAGLFTVYALIERPDSFNAYVAGSPMIGHCPDFIYEKTGRLFDENRELSQYLFMIYGENDFDKVTSYLPDYTSYITTQSPADFACQTRILEEEGHVPFISLYEGLRYIFSEWQFPEARQEEAGLDELERHFSETTKRYGFRSEIPLDLLISLGYRLIEEGETAEAIEALLLAAEAYPHSPDAFYYLAAAYEKGNDIDRALENYERALKVDPEYQMAADKIQSLKEKK